MAEITIKELIDDLKDDLRFEVISGKDGLSRKITQVDINRPGLALIKYFKHFGYQRIQVLGKGEISYLHDISKKERDGILKEIFQYEIPCFIVDWGQPVPDELIGLSNLHNIPIISTPVPTGKLTASLIIYLEEKFTEQTLEYGTLVDICGVGVLLKGKHSVGKSECALELIERGHRLIADDSVLIKKIGNTLIGEAPPATANCIEIRGLGIINIQELFGFSAICEKKEIELVLHLELWDKEKEYERVGLEKEQEKEKKRIRILDVSIPKMVIPVGPGRNMAVIAEAAALNHRLKKMGKKPLNNFMKNA
ncbi:MAG: HPr(Ser) kinase/phosphatase [bacterium]